MRTDTIGKYGVGAKLAALNFARRIDIWTCQTANGTWRHVYFDLDEALESEKQGGDVGVDPPPSPCRYRKNWSMSSGSRPCSTKGPL